MSAKPITGEDLRDLRESYSLGSQDFSWLIARPLHTVRLSREGGSEQPVKDRRLAILTRVLLKAMDPDLAPIPQMPSYATVLRRAGQFWSPPRNWALSERKRGELTYDVFGKMMGANNYAARSWRDGGGYDPIVSRLFWVLNNLIESRGAEGFDLFIQAVEEQALAEGFEGFDAVLKDKWFNEHGARESAKAQAKAGFTRKTRKKTPA